MHCVCAANTLRLRCETHVHAYASMQASASLKAHNQAQSDAVASDDYEKADELNLLIEADKQAIANANAK